MKHSANPRHLRLLPFVLASTFAASGCSRATGTGIPQFPSENALARIQSSPAPTPEAVFQRLPANVDRWELATPLPDTIGPQTYAGPDAELRAIAERYEADPKRRRLTEGMSCYAREHGRFWLAHQGSPPEDIQRFVAARCGTSIGAVETQFRYRERAGGEPLPSSASYRSELEDMLADAPADALMGAWVGADELHEIAIVVTGTTEVELEPVSMATANATHVDIVGRLHATPGWVTGHATRGTRGYSACQPLPSHEGRRLALRCPVDPSDEYALIEVFGAAKGELLGHSMLSLMVLPGSGTPSASPPSPASSPTPRLPVVDVQRTAEVGATGTLAAAGVLAAPAVQRPTVQTPSVQTPHDHRAGPQVQSPRGLQPAPPTTPSTQAPPAAAPAPSVGTTAPVIPSAPVAPSERARVYQAATLSLPVSSGDHEPTSYLAAINHLRREEGLQPLQLERVQSDVVEGLLPHYLAAQGEGNRKQAEEIALGVMAGYQVRGTIRDAGLLSFVGHDSWSIERSLCAALLSPAYRATVLDPDDRALALGSIADASLGARAFMLVSYQFFVERSYELEQAALLEEIDRQRAARGLGPVIPLVGPQTDALLRESADRVQRGEIEPIDELGELLQVFVDSSGRSFQGQVIGTLVLDGWRPELPRDLLRAEEAYVAIVITHRQVPGSAWGEHVVMMLFG